MIIKITLYLLLLTTSLQAVTIQQLYNDYHAQFSANLNATDEVLDHLANVYSRYFFLMQKTPTISVSEQIVLVQQNKITSTNAMQLNVEWIDGTNTVLTIAAIANNNLESKLRRERRQVVKAVFSAGIAVNSKEVSPAIGAGVAFRIFSSIYLQNNVFFTKKVGISAGFGVFSKKLNYSLFYIYDGSHGVLAALSTKLF